MRIVSPCFILETTIETKIMFLSLVKFASVLQMVFSAAYKNPLVRANVADPGILKVGRTYYVFATNYFDNVITYRSSNLINWQRMPDALPQLPSWVVNQPGVYKHVWAPGAIRIRSGLFALYYTAVHRTIETWSGGQYWLHCIDVATSTRPEGPYTPRPASEPMFCERAQGGAIDPQPFRDVDGKLYLLWKNDGNAKGMPAHLYIDRLTDDGLAIHPQSTRKSFFNNRDIRSSSIGRHTDIIENPFLLLRNGTYYLSFSYGNFWDTTYAIGYATSKTLMGNYKPTIKHLAGTGNGVISPGGQSMVKGPDCKIWMVYHSTFPAANGQTERHLSLERVSFGEQGHLNVGLSVNTNERIVNRGC